ILLAVFFLSFSLGRYAVPLPETVSILADSVGRLLSRSISFVIPDLNYIALCSPILKNACYRSHCLPLAWGCTPNKMSKEM
ncbi:MAG: hypothetical protein II277_02160, partial [Bacteroidales bacterium]|nr:hypothetical protein [Bacteroidales bacterium]